MSEHPQGGRLSLTFISPSYLNSLSQVEEGIAPKQWETPEGEPLYVDLSSWHIISGASSSPIDKWFVDEDNAKMSLDSSDGSYKPLSYEFAVSMLGQLVKPKDLINYLGSLANVYSIKL